MEVAFWEGLYCRKSKHVLGLVLDFSHNVTLCWLCELQTLCKILNKLEFIVCFC
jgi:hypothetical protein